MEAVSLLVDRGANVNAKDKFGWTPLTLAAQEGHLDVVKLMIEKGADKNAASNYSFQPMH